MALGDVGPYDFLAQVLEVAVGTGRCFEAIEQRPGPARGVSPRTS